MKYILSTLAFSRKAVLAMSFLAEVCKSKPFIVFFLEANSCGVCLGEEFPLAWRLDSLLF
jgi:hypothetical protein